MLDKSSKVIDSFFLTAIVARNFAIILDQAFYVRTTMLILGPIIFTIVTDSAASISIVVPFACPISTGPTASTFTVVGWQFVNTTFRMKKKLWYILLHVALIFIYTQSYYDNANNVCRLPWGTESVSDVVVSRSIRVVRRVAFVVDSSVVSIEKLYEICLLVP